ncbi:MAG TPA: M28 family peptidase [Actinomycetota bacterium]|nr:M28 family peptidase [Actinomycetota bacterium]
MKARTVLSLLLFLGAAVMPSPRAAEPSAYDHLRAILDGSPAPEYRRAGSPGMAAIADYAAGRLGSAGYHVVRQDFVFTRYAIDYAAGHAPMLERLVDGYDIKVESAFNLQKTTPAAGITCTVRPVDEVTPGDCGFVPFRSASPEWKNAPFVDASARLDQILAAGGVAAIVQGDDRRNLVFAMSVRKPLPTVVAATDEAAIVGAQIRLRTMGGFVPATGHNVLGVRRPPEGSRDYVVLLAHADGWFQAAADNGSGAAAILRAGELLAGIDPGVGVIVALMDAEEVGLIGAERFADALTTGLSVGDGAPPIGLENVKAVINLDASSARASDVQGMLRATAARADVPVFQWRAMVFSEEPLLQAAFLARYAAHGVLGLPVPSSVFAPVGAGEIGGRLRSDVQHFAASGIPFVWPVSGYPEYHTDGDTLASVYPEDLEALALATADLVGDIALLPIGRVPEPFWPPFGGAAELPAELEATLHAHLPHEH